MTNAHICHTLRPVQSVEFDIMNPRHVASIRRTLDQRRLDPEFRFAPSKGFSSAITQAQAEAFRVMSVVLEKGWLNEEQLNLLRVHIAHVQKREEERNFPMAKHLKLVASAPTNPGLASKAKDVLAVDAAPRRPGAVAVNERSGASGLFVKTAFPLSYVTPKAE